MPKLLDLEHFTAHIEAATRKAGIPVEKREGSLLWVKLHNNTLRCNLTTIYQAYQASPHRLESIVQAHLAALKKMPAVPLPPSEKEAAQSLLPLLQQASWLAQKKQSGATAILHQPLVKGIIITYVFDTPVHRAYLNEGMAQQIVGDDQGKLDALHAYALNNLRLRVVDYKMIVLGTGRERLITCETQDGYGATTVLLPDMMEKWADQIQGQMLIGVPNRDFIIAFSDQHPSGVETIARQVRRDATKRQNPLLSRLLLWDNGTIREYSPLH